MEKFTPFESEKIAFEHFLDTVSLKWGNKLSTGLAENFVKAGLLSKNVSLPRDMKYTGFYRRLPGIRKYFVATGIAYSWDFVITESDCIEFVALSPCAFETQKNVRILPGSGIEWVGVWH